jgi:ribosomal protein S18 acetylase RimI-like enzyme
MTELLIDDGVLDDRVLDNPGWASLTGIHARFAEIRGRAARYRPDVSSFMTLADPGDPQAWADAAELAGPGAEVFLAARELTPPPGWTAQAVVPGVQLVDETMEAVADEDAVVLGDADLSEILDLVERTKPGPFRPRTIELGTYLGIRRDGELVAMAGERLHPPGYTEISAVCTDPAFRGQGLAARLIRAVAHGIRSRGETPFLHAAAANTNAIRLYEKLGFVHRSDTTFAVYRTPAAGR